MDGALSPKVKGCRRLARSLLVLLDLALHVQARPREVLWVDSILGIFSSGVHDVPSIGIPIVFGVWLWAVIDTAVKPEELVSAVPTESGHLASPGRVEALPNARWG